MTMDPLIGQTVLGRYEVERRIGSGGMGAVYTGKQKAVQRQVALKILRSDLTTNEHVRERFRREAEIIGKLRHPNTIQLIDYGETDDGLAVMVMELLVGRPLNDALKERGPLALHDALQVGIEVAQSLAEAHLLGLVHRDLKPANIFLVEVAGQTHAKVLDFGIARILDEEATRLTSTGQVFGTPRYMSPEQALSTGEVDSRSDIYSLGLIVYECIVGQPPFVAQTSIQYLSAHSTMPPPKLREHYPDAPEVLENLIDACLAKEPVERPQTAEQVAKALGQIQRAVEKGGEIDPNAFRRPSTATGSGGTNPASTGQTRTQLSGTKTEIRPKGNTETAIGDGSPPTAVDKTLLKPHLQNPSHAAADARPGSGSGGGAKTISPLLPGAIGFVVVAVAAVVMYLRMSSYDVETITGTIGDAGPAVVQEAAPDTGAGSGARMVITAVDVADAGESEVVAESPDASQVAEAARSDAGEGAVAVEGEHATKSKTKTKGLTKGRDPAHPGVVVNPGTGIVTGPAQMTMQGEAKSDLVKFAKTCKASTLKGPAKLTLKGCKKDCAIVVNDDECGGRTPADGIAIRPGFLTVAVVCGSKVALNKSVKFSADETTELSCR